MWQTELCASRHRGSRAEANPESASFVLKVLGVLILVLSVGLVSSLQTGSRHTIVHTRRQFCSRYICTSRDCSRLKYLPTAFLRTCFTPGVDESFSG